MENTGSKSSSKNSGNILVIVLVVMIILLGLFAFQFVFNYSKIDQLTRALNNTQQEVAEVKKEAADAKEDALKNLQGNLQDVAGAIKDVKNPAVRLALTKAYAAKLSTLLTASERQDLNTVVLYIEKNPSVLFQSNPNLPSDVKEALTNLDARITAARSNAVATVQAVDAATFTPNEIVTITGTLEYVGDDEVLGGSYFTIKDKETGYVFYLHFNEANSENIREDMLDSEVTLRIRVTSKANEPLTFDIISGPTPVGEAAPTTTQPTVVPTTPPAAN